MRHQRSVVVYIASAVVLSASFAVAACGHGVGVGIVPPSPTPTSPPSLTGKWTFTFKSATVLSCTSTPPGFCSSLSASATGLLHISGPVTFQQSGTHLVMNSSGTSQTGTPQVGTEVNCVGWNFLDSSGTFTGNTVTLRSACNEPLSGQGETGTVALSATYTGAVLSANQMKGKFTLTTAVTGTLYGQPVSEGDEIGGDWTATRTAS